MGLARPEIENEKRKGKMKSGYLLDPKMQIYGRLN